MENVFYGWSGVCVLEEMTRLQEHCILNEFQRRRVNATKNVGRRNLMKSDITYIHFNCDDCTWRQVERWFDNLISWFAVSGLWRRMVVFHSKLFSYCWVVKPVKKRSVVKTSLSKISDFRNKVVFRIASHFIMASTRPYKIQGVPSKPAVDSHF